MTLKDWVDLFTGGGAAISAIAAGVAAWAARTSARAAQESSAATRAAINSNEQIANNDRRIRLMEDRMKVWRAFDDLMQEYLKTGRPTPDMIIAAHKQFQFVPFLFPSDVDVYLTKLNKRMWRQWLEESQASYRREGMNWKEQHRDKLKELKLRTWLTNQQRDGKKIFQRYMSLID